MQSSMAVAGMDALSYPCENILTRRANQRHYSIIAPSPGKRFAFVPRENRYPPRIKCGAGFFWIMLSAGTINALFGLTARIRFVPDSRNESLHRSETTRCAKGRYRSYDRGS